ncbi:hypothetical protein [Streptomyces sp. NPDC058045]|uniref:MmyB family transcriptional regulator n=1 Tax=Streptomyces sp. NPDC058045 TaxID=3346311 RepID=UPI0036E77965
MTTRGTRKGIDRARPVRLRPGLRAALDAISDAPAMILNDRLDVIAINQLGRALLEPVLQDDRPNLARFLFLDEDASTSFYPEWDRVAEEHIYRLRIAATKDPYDQALHRLVGELSTASIPFRTRWSTKRLCPCRPPRVIIAHPVVGEVELHCADLVTVAESLTLRICTAEVGSASDERLRILASWTQDAGVAENTVPLRAHDNRKKRHD